MRVYGLIGRKLSHSFSQQYFTDKLEKLGLKDRRFELFPLDDIKHFPELINREKNLHGLCVTIPYKESVIPYLHSLDEEAASIGAVNCIQLFNGKLKGFNTDVIGFENSLAPLLKSFHTKALVLGTGGGSKAVQFVLNKLNIPFLLASRKPTTADATIGYDVIDERILHDHPLIINTTPLGMTPDISTLPLIPYQYITERNLLYDLVYTPPVSRFLEEGLRHGATTKNGYEMLVLQAEENWQIWNES